jgi:hypothetical protein
MVSQESEEMVPLFLKDLAQDIFVCGKAVNLLKLCCPDVRILNTITGFLLDSLEGLMLNLQYSAILQSSILVFNVRQSPN